jgi:hypothetical protein
MENEYAKHELDYMKLYREKGYDANFRFENDKLINSDSKHTYNPQAIYIVAEHRYEGMSNPSDMSILYVIETDKGEKGTILLAYGPNADMEAADFFKEIPEANISNKKNINKK